MCYFSIKKEKEWNFAPGRQLQASRMASRYLTGVKETDRGMVTISTDDYIVEVIIIFFKIFPHFTYKTYVLYFFVIDFRELA
jgi:hypothetical protein